MNSRALFKELVTKIEIFGWWFVGDIESNAVFALANDNFEGEEGELNVESKNLEAFEE